MFVTPSYTQVVLFTVNVPITCSYLLSFLLLLTFFLSVYLLSLSTTLIRYEPCSSTSVFNESHIGTGLPRINKKNCCSLHEQDLAIIHSSYPTYQLIFQQIYRKTSNVRRKLAVITPLQQWSRAQRNSLGSEKERHAA